MATFAFPEERFRLSCGDERWKNLMSRVIWNVFDCPVATGVDS